MADPDTDALSPANKDPAEGPRADADGAEPTSRPEESHLGAAGEPAEGGREADD